ncbi:hypothetical protein GMRT_10114 [Giardia muris]|uniref:Uncharacterized protein n=1 Tax=Giardia muris TaxID=5742 RepID=A0A4Z1SPL6_GIAMU|nr:hypothetical protein GMRT_10114 [Giardia muris]|eukprot:TNJ27764.1 hypothetical protein GMRT_10114 [Giardia muris]
MSELLDSFRDWLTHVIHYVPPRGMAPPTLRELQGLTAHPDLLNHLIRGTLTREAHADVRQRLRLYSLLQERNSGRVSAAKLQQTIQSQRRDIIQYVTSSLERMKACAAGEERLRDSMACMVDLDRCLDAVRSLDGSTREFLEQVENFLARSASTTTSARREAEYLERQRENDSRFEDKRRLILARVTKTKEVILDMLRKLHGNLEDEPSQLLETGSLAKSDEALPPGHPRLAPLYRDIVSLRLDEKKAREEAMALASDEQALLAELFGVEYDSIPAYVSQEIQQKTELGAVFIRAHLAGARLGTQVILSYRERLDILVKRSFVLATEAEGSGVQLSAAKKDVLGKHTQGDLLLEEGLRMADRMAAICTDVSRTAFYREIEEALGHLGDCYGQAVKAIGSGPGAPFQPVQTVLDDRCFTEALQGIGRGASVAEITARLQELISARYALNPPGSSDMQAVSEIMCAEGSLGISREELAGTVQHTPTRDMACFLSEYMHERSCYLLDMSLRIAGEDTYIHLLESLQQLVKDVDTAAKRCYTTVYGEHRITDATPKHTKLTAETALVRGVQEACLEEWYPDLQQLLVDISGSKGKGFFTALSGKLLAFKEAIAPILRPGTNGTTVLEKQAEELARRFTSTMQERTEALRRLDDALRERGYLSNVVLPFYQ